MSDQLSKSNDLIVEKRLRHFINKFYRVKIIQGIIFSAFVALLILIALISIGNIIGVPESWQIVFSIAGVVILVVVIAVWVLKPLAQMLGIIKGLNFKEASGIIREKHQSVEDRIVNIIELARERTGKNNVLYDYAIEQKSENVREINFDDAVSLRKLMIFTIRLVILGVIGITAYVFWPDFVKRGMGVMWSGNQQITEMKAIEFTVLNDSLTVEAGKDFLLRFTVETDFPIDQVGVMMGSEVEKAERIRDTYEYSFNAVNSAITFRLSANGELSGEYALSILKRPGIIGLQLIVVPPGYTRLENSVMDGSGNAEVPVGSRVFWKIRTVNTDALFLVYGNDTVPIKEKGNSWNYEKIIAGNTDYEIICNNANGLSINFFYRILVAKDLFPSIDISESRDSTVMNELYIEGIIQDDFGFSKLEVVESRDGVETASEIAVSKRKIFDTFYYTIVADTSQVDYFFRVWDNDWVAGPKFSESRRISLKIRSKEELENLNDILADSIKSTMKEGMSAIERMEKKISEFRMEQLVGELKPWEVQERIKELTGIKNEVLRMLENIQEADKEFTENESMLERDAELAEQAKEIQELLNELMDDEMKELLRQFEELAKEFNSRKAEELSEQMEMSLEKLKEQMDMSLELLKKYDMEKDLLNQIGQLEKMADSLDNQKGQEEGMENQLKEDFKKWDEEFQKNLDQDKLLKKPMGLEEMKQERDEVKKAADDLDKKESGDSREQKNSKASKSLKKLAGKMKEMMGIMKGEGESVDLEDVRQIRNSLNDFSKKQEEINGRIVGINTNSPTFSVVIREQKVLEEKFLRIQDSLKSIGYKQPIVAKMIGSELFHVETSMKNLFASYAENRANVVRIEQNKIMTEVNSIAVKLDELISSMENAKGQGSSEGSQAFTDRKKPKSGEQKGSEKLGETRSQQQSMKEQLKSAIQKMKSGNTGKKERGDMARMLGEREMMRKGMEKLLQDGGLGTEARERANDALKLMKEIEKDIIYNRLSDQTLKRDELIRTRLLEAENAEKERESENRRESKEFRGSFEPNRKELGTQEDATKDMEQLLKYNELKLKKFYQEKYQKYIDSTKK